MPNQSELSVKIRIKENPDREGARKATEALAKIGRE